MDANEMLKKYENFEMYQKITYDPNVFCDVASMLPWDVPKKIAIGVAFTGSFIDKRQNPNQPYTVTEILEQAYACIEAGATSLHFHVRDKNGANIGDVEEYRKIIDPIRKKYGDKVIIDGCPVFGSTFKDACAPVTAGLFEVGIVNPVCTFVSDNVRWLPPPSIRAQCEYFQALGKKVLCSVHDTASIGNIERFLIRPGILKKPYYFGILVDLPGMAYTPHPKALIEHVILIVNRLKELDPDCRMNIACAGRASLFAVTLGIMLGLDVRVGTEDTVWRLPHKNEKWESNVQAFLHAKALCELLGREIADAKETREMIGIKPWK